MSSTCFIPHTVEQRTNKTDKSKIVLFYLPITCTNLFVILKENEDVYSSRNDFLLYTYNIRPRVIITRILLCIRILTSPTQSWPMNRCYFFYFILNNNFTIILNIIRVLCRRQFIKFYRTVENELFIKRVGHITK